MFGTPYGTNIAAEVALVGLVRACLATFEVLEEISTDGRPEFTAFVTKSFLNARGVAHRVSSLYFPQSNGRAEVAVKTAKRIIIANVSPKGDLNNDSFLRALLHLRNTLDPDCGLSPAEVVFGRPLRDAFSFINRHVKFSNRFLRRTWRETRKAIKNAFRMRARRNDDALLRHSRPLSALLCGDRVFVQIQKGKYLRK